MLRIPSSEDSELLTQAIKFIVYYVAHTRKLSIERLAYSDNVCAVWSLVVTSLSHCKPNLGVLPCSLNLPRLQVVTIIVTTYLHCKKAR